VSTRNRPFTQGVALGYHIVPLWGGKIGAPLGQKTGVSLWRKTSAPLERKIGAPLGRKIGASGLFVFNPNGVTGESPGQRPGFAYGLDTQALKGRYEDARGMRCRSILKLNLTTVYATYAKPKQAHYAAANQRKTTVILVTVV